MKITIIAIGKEKEFPAHELVSEYTARTSHTIAVEWTYLPASSDPREEHERLLKAIDGHMRGGSSYVVALDETGKQFDSRGFASFVEGRMNEGLKSLVFIIGGAYGLSPEIRAVCRSTLALSSLTFPHQLVRLILAEQLYRAMTIIKGEKYHH